MGWIGRTALVVFQAGPTGRVQEAGGKGRPERLPGDEPVGGTINKPEIFRTGVNKKKGFSGRDCSSGKTTNLPAISMKRRIKLADLNVAKWSWQLETACWQ